LENTAEGTDGDGDINQQKDTDMEGDLNSDGGGEGRSGWGW